MEFYKLIFHKNAKICLSYFKKVVWEKKCIWKNKEKAKKKRVILMSWQTYGCKDSTVILALAETMKNTAKSSDLEAQVERISNIFFNSNSFQIVQIAFFQYLKQHTMEKKILRMQK